MPWSTLLSPFVFLISTLFSENELQSHFKQYFRNKDRIKRYFYPLPFDSRIFSFWLHKSLSLESFDKYLSTYDSSKNSLRWTIYHKILKRNRQNFSNKVLQDGNLLCHLECKNEKGIVNIWPTYNIFSLLNLWPTLWIYFEYYLDKFDKLLVIILHIIL